MLHALAMSLLINWTGGTATAQQLDEQGNSAYSVAKKPSEQPLRLEQDCPPPETVDVFQTSSWNTVEVGLSFPLGDNNGEARPYTRYTCPNPNAKARR